MQDKIKIFVEKSLSERLGGKLSINSMKMLGGGCINHASKLQTNKGDFFIKWNASGPDDMFLREAECLEALNKAKSELQIPKVYLKTKPSKGLPAMLITEFLQPSNVSSIQQDEILGRGIAQLHQFHGTAYGFAHDNYCGATPQNNDWQQDWVTFFRDQRIGALLKMIEQSRGLSKDEWAVYDQLLNNISNWIAHQAKPSLNHGDLWSGNYMYSAQGPALIDPASYFADREFDLALMEMFGGYSSTVWEAYQEYSPLPDEWKERQDLYMLYHYLNHYQLFGGYYGQQALSIAKKYG